MNLNWLNNTKRSETRRQRSLKKNDVKTIPVELCLINFMVEENIAFCLRSAACFGCETINVIGSIPDHKKLVARSGTTQDYVKLNKFSNPQQFLEYIRKNNILLISAELDEEAISIHDFIFLI